jgi:uncharacterized membrane protein
MNRYPSGVVFVRIIWVVLGVVLLIVGVVLLFVPVMPQTSQSLTAGTSQTSSDVYLGQVSGWSLTGNIPVAISWNSSADVIVGYATQSGACPSYLNVSNLVVSTQNGTSGSFTVNQPNGGCIVLAAAGYGSVVTFKITTSLTLIGTILVFVGIIVMIVGIVLRGKPKAQPQPGYPQQMAPMGGYPGAPPPPTQYYQQYPQPPYQTPPPPPYQPTPPPPPPPGQ